MTSDDGLLARMAQLRDLVARGTHLSLPRDEALSWIAVIAAVQERVDTDGWCIVCGGGLEHTIADDDTPEGLVFRHREGCALARLDGEAGS